MVYFTGITAKSMYFSAEEKKLTVEESEIKRDRLTRLDLPKGGVVPHA
jgi:hypothetical protein